MHLLLVMFLDVFGSKRQQFKAVAFAYPASTVQITDTLVNRVEWLRKHHLAVTMSVRQ